MDVSLKGISVASFRLGSAASENQLTGPHFAQPEVNNSTITGHGDLLYVLCKLERLRARFRNSMVLVA